MGLGSNKGGDMSREYKFRLRKNGQIVGYEMWFEGDGLAKPRWIYAYPDGQFNLSNPYIEHDSKEMFTGLRDQKGKEIYEGDIIAVPGFGWTPYTSSKKLFNAEVHWDNRGSGYELLLPPRELSNVEKQLRFNPRGFTGLYEDRAKVSEIIGNTTDNPELLKDAA